MNDERPLPWSLRFSWTGFGLGVVGPLGALILVFVIPEPDEATRGWRFLSFFGQFLIFLLGALWGGLWGMAGAGLAIWADLEGAPKQQVRWALATNLLLFALAILTAVIASVLLG